MVQESLAEYAMAAALHFNKQIPRCQQNRKEKRWDKFVMDTLDGKTIGFL
jgi:sodium/hydrogen exchanger 8